MLDVGTHDRDGGDEADLTLFAERLAAAGADEVTVAAHAQIRAAIARHATPPGLRRLAEALAASLTERPPVPRHPAEDRDAVVPALRGTPLVVLDGYDVDAVAATVSALAEDGRRVLVTAATGPELAAVRAALPSPVVGLALNGLPSMSPGEVRELRRLAASTTGRRRARTDQELPAADDLLDPAEVTRLCERVSRAPSSSSVVGQIPGLLEPLPDDRCGAVTALARRVLRTLADLPEDPDHPARTMLADLIYGRRRTTFDRLQQDVASAVDAMDRIRGGPPVRFLAPLPENGVGALRRYQSFLAEGGRARNYFRAAVQREVLPVLATIRVGTHAPETEPDLARVLVHLQLVEHRNRIEASCAELAIPRPHSEEDLVGLRGLLDRVAAAARAVSSLRHDVLFLADDSPVAVPDVATAGDVAAAIVTYAEHGSAGEATARLDDFAARLAGRCPVRLMSPEHEAAVAALRARDAQAYGTAVRGLAAARREAADERRCTELLTRLAGTAPELATAWARSAEEQHAAPGLVAFIRIDDVLTALPTADTTDVVVVLGAGALGVERLLLAAAAPRMVAVAGPGRVDGSTTSEPTVLSVLQRAGAMTVRGAAVGKPSRVLRPAPSPNPRAQVGQIGA